MAKLCFLLAMVLGFGCSTVASEDEVERMCAHLKELRKNTNIETDLKKCKAEAQQEGVSKRQALCRISAVNTLEYWNRCRTGEAK